jgi:hypothetical protein
MELVHSSNTWHFFAFSDTIGLFLLLASRTVQFKQRLSYVSRTFLDPLKYLCKVGVFRTTVLL